METPIVYIPMDRRQALARGETLPDRTHGSALFADISGFTPLSEALVFTLGAQRGAEELTHQLNLVYDAVIHEVDRYGGSVIGFSGDAITCWFDRDDGCRATACALMMQRAMAQFGGVALPSGGLVTLAMKAAIASGPVRRFLVGDPDMLLIDVLAGETLARVAAAEHLAYRAEVVLSPECRPALGDSALVVEWRAAHNGAAGAPLYPVIGGLMTRVQEQPWPLLASHALDEAQLRPWLLPSIYERLRSVKGDFLAELRPAAALFLNFSGIDYDGDAEAGAKLDAFIRWVQHIIARYDGALLQLTIGDKGSYLQIAFGAPIAHDDDAARAVAASLELCTPPAPLAFIRDVQIGIGRGRMRAGPYGGSTRRTYGLMGDEVNLAARLMQRAAAGQVIVSQRIVDATRNTFDFVPLPPLPIKGKTRPVNVFALAGARARQARRSQEPNHTLPMVGREAELNLITQQIEIARKGKGQIIAITADAGMGKSRLVSEAIRAANAQGFVCYGSACQSYGANTAYLVWHDIWRVIFDLDATASLEEQTAKLEHELARIDRLFVRRMPLLGVVLNLALPDNELTESLDARLRKASLEALLADCLRARAKSAPLLLALEDCHWLDPLSHDLLEVLARSIVNLPVVLLLAYRPPQLERLQTPRVMDLPHATVVKLNEFTPGEAAQLIELKLARFGDGWEDEAHPQEIPQTFVERISARAQGNPFYIEELLNYLHDRGLDPRHIPTVAQIELPDSLHSLLLSRIDQLRESQKVTLKVASIIGRLFPVKWLWGVYPQLGEEAQVTADLDVLSQLDLTPLDTPEPERRHIFKHIVTQEVAYESQPYATRAELHTHLGQFIERTYADSLENYLDLLAYHYGQSNHLEKQREYYIKAGKAAQAAYAPEAAIGYYQKALVLWPSEMDTALTKQRLELYNALGSMLNIRAQYKEAIEIYTLMRSEAEITNDVLAQARASYGLATAQSYQGDHRAALESAEQSAAAAQAADTNIERLAAMELKGRSLFRLGDTEAALRLGEQMLALSTEIGAQRQMARSLNLLGAIHNIAGRYLQAEQCFTRAFENFHAMGQRSEMMTVMNNLGVIAEARGDYRTGSERYQEALNIAREIGHRAGELVFLSNLGSARVGLADYQSAEADLCQVIQMAASANPGSLSNTYHFLAEACLGQGKIEEALAAARQALALGQQAGVQSYLAAAWRSLGMVAARRVKPIAIEDKQTSQLQSYDATACFAESLHICTEARMEGERARTLRAWATYELERGDETRGAAMWQEAREVFARLGVELEVERMANLPARSEH